MTAESFRRHHPDIPFVLLLTDEVDGYFDPAAEGFEILTLDALGIPNLQQFVFQYTELEVSYAATPFLIDRLLGAGFQKVVFLKQETLVLGSLADLIQGLDRHSAFATPHMLAAPESADAAKAELDILRAGVFNGGILGMSDTLHARSFLDWWMHRAYRNCYRLVDDGLHFEQRWLDFLPSLVPDTLIVRDPGVNVGHWNLLARQVRSADGSFTAQGEPLRVFRFSGFDPERPERITRYSDLDVCDAGDAKAIFRAYQSMIVENGYESAKTWPYAYESFDNEVRIPDIVRSIYRDLSDEAARFGDPASNADAVESFYHWLGAPASAANRVSNLWNAIYDREPFVQLKFPRVEDLGREESAAWRREIGARRYGIPESLLSEAGRGWW